AEQVFPGFVQKGLDFGDFALAYAPRPFLMTTAIRDYFPIAGARMTDKQNQRLFDLLGQSEKAGYFDFDDTHGWSQPRREAAVRFLAKSLQGRETEGREANVDDVDRMKLLAETSPRFGPSGLLQTVCRLFRVPCARMTFARIS
ncbi:MAG: hypothetical protein NTX13_06720, partial [Acidobacteria bacterium]|nr:hypothetical protein [Acidobacteriota bacterium]